MDGWRVGLLVATGAFFVFLLSKLRPRLDQHRPRLARPARRPRAERRAWLRLRRLPRSAQRRIYERLGRSLAEPTDGDDGDDPPGAE